MKKTGLKNPVFCYNGYMKAPKEKEIKQDLPKPLEPVMKEAEHIIKNSIESIHKRLNNPVEKAVDAAGNLTTGAQLKQLLKEAGKEQAKIALNSIENLVLGGIALVPVLGQVEGGAVASAELTEAAILEGATLAQAQALAKGAVVTGAGEVVYPLTRIIGAEGAKRVTKVLKTLDPFPDVPTIAVLGAGAAELMGVHGAAAIPSAVQILINEYKSMRNLVGTGRKAGDIVLKSPEMERVKDFGSNVVTSITNRLKVASSPQMAQAAARFA